MYAAELSITILQVGTPTLLTEIQLQVVIDVTMG